MNGFISDLISLRVHNHIVHGLTFPDSTIPLQLKPTQTRSDLWYFNEYFNKIYMFSYQDEISNRSVESNLQSKTNHFFVFPEVTINRPCSSRALLFGVATSFCGLSFDTTGADFLFTNSSIRAICHFCGHDLAPRN